MKFRFSATAITFMLIAQCLPAQAPQSSSSSNAFVPVVAKLNKDLNAKKLKVGDKITAEVTQDVLLNGKIVVPRESKLVGHIAEVEPLTKTNSQSRISLVFDLGRLKRGGTLHIQGLIEALAPPLADPFLEAAMGSSSPYNPGVYGHPVTGAMSSSGQTNTPNQVTPARPRDSAVRALEDRQKALDDAKNPQGPGPGRNGALGGDSRGVFGLPGLSLNSIGVVSTIGSVRKNVELKSGTQIVIALQSPSTTINK